MVRWYPVFLFLCATTTPDLRHIAGIRGFSIIEVTMEAPSGAIIVIDQQWGLQALSRESPGANRGLALDKRLRLLARYGPDPEHARAGSPG